MVVSSPRPDRSAARMLVAAALVAVALGALALVADAAPGAVGRVLVLVASTGAAWGVAAVVVGMRAPRPGVAALAGASVMAGAVLVYYGAGELLDLRAASSTAAARAGRVWGALALVAGPTLGMLGWYGVRTTGRGRSVIWGVLGGLLASQAFYLMTRIPGGLLGGEAGPLRLVVLVLIAVPVALVVAGSRRRHLLAGLPVMVAVGLAGAIVWGQVLHAV